MSRSMDFICAPSASSFSSAVAIREVRDGGLGLHASEWGNWDGFGGGSTGSWESIESGGGEEIGVEGKWIGRVEKLGGAVESATVEVGEGGGGKLHGDDDESGGGGDGGFGGLTARQLWIQPSATVFYESSIRDGSEGSGTKCYDSSKVDRDTGVHAR